MSSPCTVPCTVPNNPTQSFNPPTIQDLKQDGIRFVRITWLDYSSTTRFRVLPISYFEKLLASDRPGISLTKSCMATIGIKIPKGFSHIGGYLYALDLASLRRCPYAPGHASVFGWLQEWTPHPSTKSVEVGMCPRTLLNNLVVNARCAGISFLAGFETEFTLLHSTDPIKPINCHNGYRSEALHTGSTGLVILEEIAEALSSGGIDLEMYHAGAAPGQYEIVTGPLPPLEAADALVFTRETLANIASKHELRATLAPRIFNYTYGSASHVHVSIHSTCEGSSPDLAPTLKPYEASFLQSLLDNLPAICAFSLPTAASYGRVADGILSGGTYICWGTNNKEAPIRVCGQPNSHNFELRCVDGTSNPYLVLGAIIAAGLEGVVAKKNEIAPRERTKLGIDDMLPGSIEDARKLLRASSTMKTALGVGFISKYLTFNQLLQEHLSAETTELEMGKIAEFY